MDKISIIMGIYNCADTLEEALNSIFNQTYKNWEIIMCDDGSTDDTYDIALKFKEICSDKVILLRNETNKGLNYTLNRCLAKATGKYIARMDGDDISLPHRFEEQIKFLKTNQYEFVSTPMILFDENGDWGKTKVVDFPSKYDFSSNTPFSHAPLIIKTKVLREVGGYTEDKRLLRVEDMHLWMKLYKHGYLGANIKEPLYKMRDDREARNRRKFKYRLNESYVRFLYVKELNLPARYFIYVVKPIIIGLMPNFIYDILHKSKLRSSNEVIG